MSRLPHVVWDMGGILFRYFTELMVEVGAPRGWPLEEMPLGPTGVVPDFDYLAMRRGELDEPEYLKRVVGRLERWGIWLDPMEDLDWTGQERPETWEAIKAIHAAGHRQAILTNDASKWLGPGWWESWEHGRWFDVMVDVATLGARKPDPAPYLATAAALGADPGSCLFIDDMEVNCRGAEAVGMEALWFDVTDPGGSVGRLLARLGLPPGTG